MEGIWIDWHPVAVAALLMLLDIGSGFVGAFRVGEVDSAKMRDGLWHKAGFCGLILLAAVYEVAAAWIDFEVASLGFGVAVPELPAVGAVCVYIVVTELVSIIENLCVLNPDIERLPFVGRLKQHDPGAADLTVAIEDDDVARSA